MYRDYFTLWFSIRCDGCIGLTESIAQAHHEPVSLLILFQPQEINLRRTAPSFAKMFCSLSGLSWLIAEPQAHVWNP